MSTAATLTLPATRRPDRPRREKVTARRVLNAEWIKFRTLRSTWLTLAAAVAAMIGIGAVIGYTTSTAAEVEPDLAVASGPLAGFFLAQLLVGVLGVLFVTAEYGSGMIRSTFQAVPRRWPVVAAKATVFGAVALVAMTLAALGGFLAAQIFLGPEGRGSSLTDDGVLGAIAGTGVYLTAAGLLGGALGWILRSTASALAALLGTLMILPLLVPLLGSVGDTIVKYLPSEAGAVLSSSVTQPDLLAPGAALAVLGAWVVAALAVGLAVVKRRDA
jgi:hypothetical protein